MRRVKIATLVVLAALTMAACSRTRPILEITDRPIPAPAQKLSLDAIAQNMTAAGQPRHWQFAQQGPGRLQATYAEDNHVAVVDINFTQQIYSIHLDHSSGLMQSGNEIHHNYNVWVNQLAADIDERLSKAGVNQQ